mmetsp:Transcript_44786/g.129454  ORF Transcript_44786/g.129454 Transcript_44786/m.129454 type:complete len:204 (-) Transcript_44786:545-1156(-)
MRRPRGPAVPRSCRRKSSPRASGCSRGRQRPFPLRQRRPPTAPSIPGSLRPHSWLPLLYMPRRQPQPRAETSAAKKAANSSPAAHRSPWALQRCTSCPIPIPARLRPALPVSSVRTRQRQWRPCRRRRRHRWQDPRNHRGRRRKPRHRRRWHMRHRRAPARKAFAPPVAARKRASQLCSWAKSPPQHCRTSPACQLHPWRRSA